jgi:hypothetical protein
VPPIVVHFLFYLCFSTDLYALLFRPLLFFFSFVFFTYFCPLFLAFVSCFLLSYSYSPPFRLLFLPPPPSFLDVISPLRTVFPNSFLTFFMFSSTTHRFPSVPCLPPSFSPSASPLTFDCLWPVLPVLLVPFAFSSLRLSPFVPSFRPTPFLPFPFFPFLASSTILLPFLYPPFPFSPAPLYFCPNLPIRPIRLLFQLCFLSPCFLHLFRLVCRFYDSICVCPFKSLFLTFCAFSLLPSFVPIFLFPHLHE